MTVLAIDTLKVAQKLQESGFSRKQAAGAAEVLAEVMSDIPPYASRDAVIEAVETLGHAIDQRLNEHGRRFNEQGKQINELGQTLIEHGHRLTSLEEGQKQIIETMNTNHMDLHRSLAAVLAHLGIPKPAR